MSPSERLRREPKKAFAAFVAYRDLGSDRTFGDAADSVGRPLETILEWSSKWIWDERVESWDMLRRHTQLAKGVQHLGTLGLRRLLVQAQEAYNKGDLTAKDAMDLADANDKLERLFAERIRTIKL